MSARIVTQAVFEDNGCYLLAYVAGNAATPITQSQISSIDLTVHDAGDEVGDPESVTVSSVVFDTLQTDARWTVDSRGYNFRYEVQPSQLPTGGKKRLFDFQFTPVSGPKFPLPFTVPTLRFRQVQP